MMQFDSLDEAYEWMQKRTDEANASLHPKQAAVTWGDHWCRFVDIKHRLIVFGYVETLDEIAAGEATEYDTTTEQGQAELDTTLGVIRTSHDRGYLYGRAWSIIEPTGEYGDTHRANMWPIDQALFDAAQAVRWEIDRLPDWAKDDLQTAWTENRSHAIAQVVG